MDRARKGLVFGMPQHDLVLQLVGVLGGWVALVALNCSIIIPSASVQVASKATTGHSAWCAPQRRPGAGRRYTALTERLRLGPTDRAAAAMVESSVNRWRQCHCSRVGDRLQHPRGTRRAADR